MKHLSFIFLILLIIVMPFACDDNEDKKDPNKEEDHTTVSSVDTITIPGWLDMYDKIKLKDTLDCNTMADLAVMDSTVKYVTYIIKDKCPKENSTLTEMPDEFRQITDIINDGNTFVGTYLNNYAPRFLFCRGENGIGCPYTILTDNHTTFKKRDLIIQDTLSCNRINQTIYVNATDRNITVKVTILEKCKNGTLDILRRHRNYTSLRDRWRVNQTPSTTNIAMPKNSVLILKSSGTSGKIIYKLGIE